MSPQEVGDLPIVDFLILVDGIEDRVKLRQDAMKNGGFWAA